MQTWEQPIEEQKKGGNYYCAGVFISNHGSVFAACIILSHRIFPKKKRRKSVCSMRTLQLDLGILREENSKERNQRV